MRCNDPALTVGYGTLLTFAPAEFLSSIKEHWNIPDLGLELECVTDPCKGTCKWIHETQVYRSWSGSQCSGTFLLTGKMGSGKTVLAKSTWTAIQSEKEDRPQDKELHLSYFCSRVRRKSEKADLLLWTLIYQLLEACPNIFSSADGLQDMSKVLNWPLESVWSLFWDLISQSDYESVSILIDALDECEYTSVDEFLGSYTEFCMDEYPVEKIVKFFITLRHDDGPVEGFVDSDSLWRLHIRPADVLPDIQVAMERPIKKIVSSNKWDTDQAFRLTTAIAERADGMFQWVNIALGRITRRRRRRGTHKELLGEINNIPQELEQLYSRELRDLIKDMDPVDLDQIKSLLAWVLLGSRPLTVAEMVMALSIEDGASTLPTRDEQRTSAPASLSPFIEASTNPGAETEGNDSNDSKPTVRPIHESVRQFLWDVCMKPESEETWPELFIGEAQGHAMIAKTCITYLRCRELEVGWLGGQEANEFGVIIPTDGMVKQIDEFLESHELMCYLAEEENIHFHIRQSVRDPPDDVYDRMVDVIINHHDCTGILSQARQYLNNKGTKWDYWQPGPRLHTCARGDSLELLQRFAQRIPTIDWNERDETGSTVLFDVLGHSPPADIQDAQLELFRYLMDRGSDPNVVDRLGQSPASWAVIYGHTGVLRELISRAVSLSTREIQTGRTLLHLAALELQPECARLLLEAGHEVNARDNDGETPLITAVHEGSLEIVKLLLSYDADVRILDNQKRTAMSICGMQGSCDIARLLINHHCPVLARDAGGSTALHFAVSESHLELIKLLFEAGAEIDARDKDLSTPLATAACFDRPEPLKLLVQLGADVNAQDNKSRTPLLLAVSYGLHLAVDALISLGADPRIMDERGMAPIHLAIYSRNFETVQQLLKSQFKTLTLQDKDKRGQPLHYAASAGALDIMKLLIAGGVDVFARDVNGHTPAHIAAEAENVECLRFLVEHAMTSTDPGLDNDGRLPIHYAAGFGSAECLRYLIEVGMDAGAQDNKGFSPLCFAIHRGRLVQTQILLDAGCDVNQSDTLGLTPLYYAASRGHWETVEKLLKRGALIDGNGGVTETPLLAAVEYRHREVCKILLGWPTRPDIEARGRHGQTPLFAAIVNEDDEITELLLAKGADPTTIDARGRPLLVAAATACNRRLTSLLLDRLSEFDDDILRKATEAAIVSWNLMCLHYILDHWRGPLDWTELRLLITTYRGRIEQESISNVDSLSQDQLVGLAVESSPFAARLLIGKLNPAIVDIDQECDLIILSMIHMANIRGLRALLERGTPKIDTGFNDRVLPLLPALPGDMIGEMVDLLGTHQLFSHDLADKDGWTAGHFVIRYGSLEAIRVWQARGHNFVRETKTRQSMLHLACVRRDNAVEVIDLLLEPTHQQDMAHQDDAGWSAVHFASCRTSNVKVLQSLIDKGADVGVRTRRPRGATMLHLAANGSGSELLCWILDNLPRAAVAEQLSARLGEIQKTPLHLASEFQLKELVEAILRAGGGVNDEDSVGWTPLFYAILGRNIETCRALLAHGVQDLDHQDHRGWTALHLACYVGLPEVIKLLLQYGASPGIIDNNLWTAEDVARHEQETFAEIVTDNPALKPMGQCLKSIEYPTPTSWSSEDKASEIYLSKDGLEAYLPSMFASFHNVM